MWQNKIEWLRFNNQFILKLIKYWNRKGKEARSFFLPENETTHLHHCLLLHRTSLCRCLLLRRDFTITVITMLFVMLLLICLISNVAS
jgi:hypothetical protein